MAPTSDATTWLSFIPGGSTTANANRPWTVNRIDFSGSFFYLTGSTLTFTGAQPQINGAGQFANPVQIGAEGVRVTAPANKVMDFNGGVSGPGPVMVAGGVISFGTSAPNQYTGVSIESGGVASFSYPSALGKLPAAETDDLILNGGRAQFLYITSLAATRDVLLNGAGATNTLTSFEPLSVLGQMHGSGGLRVEGQVVLTRANSYTGGTVVAGDVHLNGKGSVLRVASLAALGGSGADVAIEGSAALAPDFPVNQALLARVNPNSYGSVNLGTDSANALDLQAAGLLNVSLGAEGGSRTFSGTLTPAGDFYHLGGGDGQLNMASPMSGASGLYVWSSDNRHGRVVLTVPNSYTGDTLVGPGGQLFLSATGTTGPGIVTVDQGLLGGNGTVAGDVRLKSGSTISPGLDGPGTLSMGELVAQGGTLALMLGGNTPGTGYSQLRVTGWVSLNSTTLSLTLGYVPAVGDSFTIVDNDLAEPVRGGFSGLAEGAIFNLPYDKSSSYPFQITYAGGTGNDIVIRAVPEPRAVLALWSALGLCPVLRRKRRTTDRPELS